MKNIFIVLIFAVVFNGCAPQYVVRNQYLPPLDKNSKVCLQNCSLEKQKCKQRCAEEYSDCLSYAYEEAKKVQARSDKSYKKRYDRYLARLSDYNFAMFDWQARYDDSYSDWRYFRDKCAKDGDRYACDREDDLKYLVRKLRRSRPKEPKEPKYVTFNEILLKQQSKCSKKCGCDTLYDSCFISCGGEIVPHKICIKNCD